jgi:hypothetical protein
MSATGGARVNRRDRAMSAPTKPTHGVPPARACLPLDVDAAAVRLLLDLLTPDAVELTMAIQSELDRLTAQGEHQ